MSESRGPEFTSFWEGLGAFAEAEVAAYGVFRTIASSAGTRRGHYTLADGLQRIDYTYTKSVETEALSAHGLRVYRLSLSEVHILKGGAEVVIPNLHIISGRSDDGPALAEHMYRRPALCTARQDSGTMFQSFANLPEILCRNPAEMQAEQTSYIEWLTVMADVQMATDLK
jgi:hypothetical protein